MGKCPCMDTWTSFDGNTLMRPPFLKLLMWYIDVRWKKEMNMNMTGMPTLLCENCVKIFRSSNSVIPFPPPMQQMHSFKLFSFLLYFHKWEVFTGVVRSNLCVKDMGMVIGSHLYLTGNVGISSIWKEDMRIRRGTYWSLNKYLVSGTMLEHAVILYLMQKCLF